MILTVGGLYGEANAAAMKLQKAGAIKKKTSLKLGKNFGKDIWPEFS
jgi:hypothetical protein